MLVGTLALALAAADPTTVDLMVWYEPRRYAVEVVSGSACRYVDGRAAYLLRTRSPGRYIFLLREGDLLQRGDLVSIYRDGHWSYEINGGVTSYHSFETAIEELLPAPRLKVTNATYRQFIRSRPTRKCRHKTYDIDLYEK